VGGRPVTADELSAGGAMAVLMRDALQPNLMQTVEGTPVIVHAGPFGNIATGNSSVVGDRVILNRTEFLVTEAGFAADLGAEKLFHLKGPVLGRTPDVAVLVATVQALKYHGGPDGDLKTGAANLRRHVANLRLFGVPVVVALNRFPTDTEADLEVVHESAAGAGAVAVAEHDAFMRGGEGALALGEAVIDASRLGADFHPLYEATESAHAKVAALATRLYGAAEVRWSAAAERSLARFEEAGFGGLPVCMAKTHLSLSHDPALRGAPEGYVFPVQSVRLAAGAGMLTVLAGDIETMPGLAAHPLAADMDVDAEGRIIGLI
jgi:formate--tetrahydrofolate ligase